MSINTLYIILATLSVQGAHTYLLFSQRSQRQWSISNHALKDTKTWMIYVFGHFFGGLAWLMAANNMFVGDLRFIFHVSLATVILQWLQAATPAKKTRGVSLHTLFAYLMWIGCMSMVTLGVINLTLEPWQRLAAGGLIGLVICMFFYMHIWRDRIYHLQYISIYFFFAATIVLTL